jgi:hypothetical protein
MSAIYLNQNDVILNMDTGIDLSAATLTEILYRKPGGGKGSWPASSVSGTIMVYNAAPGDFNETGNWAVQAHVTIAGREGFGDITSMVILNSLK